MPKLIHLTDCHLVPEGDLLFDSDPAGRLRSAVADINHRHADADLCVLTGDLAHAGDPAAYRLLRAILSDLGVPYQVLPGNHDDRRALAEVFSDLILGADNSLQSFRDLAGVRLVFLDSVDPGRHSGAFGPARAAWLDAVLSECRDRAAYLFLHHPPLNLGLPRLDQYRILDTGPLEAALRPHRHVRHLFFGHVHRPVAGAWAGIPFTTTKGTHHQNLLDFSHGRENTSSLEPPAYAVILISDIATVVHFYDFLDDSARFVYDPAAPEGAQIRRLETNER